MQYLLRQSIAYNMMKSARSVFRSRRILVYISICSRVINDCFIPAHRIYLSRFYAKFAIGNTPHIVQTWNWQ